jgi:hypothetical protein
MLLLTRIISGINICNRERSLTVYLDNRWTACPSIVIYFRRGFAVTPCRQCDTVFLIKLVGFWFCTLRSRQPTNWTSFCGEAICILLRHRAPTSRLDDNCAATIYGDVSWPREANEMTRVLRNQVRGAAVSSPGASRSRASSRFPCSRRSRAMPDSSWSKPMRTFGARSRSNQIVAPAPRSSAVGSQLSLLSVQLSVQVSFPLSADPLSE